jgi:hypothetical protein
MKTFSINCFKAEKPFNVATITIAENADFYPVFNQKLAKALEERFEKTDIAFERIIKMKIGEETVIPVLANGETFELTISETTIY